MPLDLAKFQPQAQTTVAANSANTELDISSVPDGAEISIDGKFVGNTPSTLNVTSGQHTVTVKMPAYQNWERSVVTSGGKVKLSATLVSAAEANSPRETQAKQQTAVPQR
jgi:hypothetical protein